MARTRPKTQPEFPGAIAARTVTSTGAVLRDMGELTERILDRLWVGGVVPVTLAGLSRAEAVAQPVCGKCTSLSQATGPPMTIAAGPARKRAKISRIRVQPSKHLRELF